MVETLNASWKKYLKNEFEKEYFKTLSSFVEKERRTQTIFPPSELTFAALNKTSLEEVKVVILGQDPYHTFKCHIERKSTRTGLTPKKGMGNVYR